MASANSPWSPEGRRRRGRPEVEWDTEVERIMKHWNLISDNTENRQILRLVYY